MNFPLSTIDDILDFTSLAQDAVKLAQREERVRRLAVKARACLDACPYFMERPIHKFVKWDFLSEV